MTPDAIPARNQNDARSDATRERLIEATVSALTERGYSNTTGVEVCRRAGLTRGALNHHFPEFAGLLIATLETLYGQLLARSSDSTGGPLERVVADAHLRVSQPQFKAVIELWLASRNDAELGARLAEAIAKGSARFSPAMVLAGQQAQSATPAFEAAYRTIVEALIGIGLGRATGNGQPMAHEPMVLQVLTDLAREQDQQQQTT
jgi:AcrR family transcriptional regulator